MHFKDITLDYLKPLKSNMILTLTCDSCQGDISRSVKEIRHSIKKGKQNAYCSNKCQGASIRKIYTHICNGCNEDYTSTTASSKYCSRKCSNLYSNKQRTVTEETKKKISESITGKTYAKEPSRYQYRYSTNEFSKIYICNCKKCGFAGSYRKQQLYCNSCQEYYTANGRAKYIFTFNVYDYPDLFDFKLIQKYGWRSTKGKNININGVTRDHKVSVRDSILNNYDPYYIKHPLNCELMLMNNNQIKGTKSSLTYEELVKLVDEYESK